MYYRLKNTTHYHWVLFTHLFAGFRHFADVYIYCNQYNKLNYIWKLSRMMEDLF